MNASEFLKRAKKVGPLHTIFRFPYVHIIITSNIFTGLDEEEREQCFANQLKTSIKEIRNTLHNSLLMLQLETPEEFDAAKEDARSNRGNHWLRSFVDQVVGNEQPKNASVSPVKVIHFYGYKGGQARSTLLALIASALAKDGWKALVVDSDIEAPSLDVLFARGSRSSRSTLLGVVQNPESLDPDRAVTPAQSGGYVDLIACRPRGQEYDVDAAAFALRSALEPQIIEAAAKHIANYARNAGYDILLVDHRAGLSPSTIPWISSLPGPTVVFVRLDEQWRPASRFIKALFQSYLPNPGLFVSWKPDEELTEAYRQRNMAQIDTLLETLAEAISEAAEDPEDIDTELSSIELEDHWVPWPYDPSFRFSRLPDDSQLNQITLDSIATIRSLLDIGNKKTEHILLSPSGADDEGDLIQTEALLQLTAPSNRIGYVFGRKGTGKTRLLTELTRQRLGEPLLVDATDKSGLGLKSPSQQLLQAAERYISNPDRLWWHLLAAGLSIPKTDTEALSRSFEKEILEHAQEDPNQIVSRMQLSQKRTFLLDGVETAFSGKMIFSYVESLFRFLRICESDSRLSQAVQCKLFLRSDLAERGYQNLEQQLFGKSLYLTWDTQAILNFVLSRLGKYAWFQNFPELTAKIGERRAEILKGMISTEDCESLLLMAFPATLRRNNLATKTFLKTYFADSASDRPELSASNKLRYYPRIFDKFLSVIADPTTAGERSFIGSQIEDDKISQRLIFLAHEAAADEYLNQLKSELRFLIDFSGDNSENQQKIDTLLNAFSGLPTPFEVDICVQQIERKAGLGESSIRSAMDKMKSVGIFEDRPDYPGQWRVGRLFKSSLRMKYVRGPKREESLFEF